MAENVYFGDDMTGSVQTEDGTSITVSKYKDVEIVLAADHTELSSADTIKREEVKRHNFRVNVTVGVASFDVNLMQQWLGGSGANSTSVVDTTDPTTFQITGEVSPADGSGANLKAVVEEVYFDEMPVFSATEEEYVVNEMEGVGKDLTLTGE